MANSVVRRVSLSKAKRVALAMALLVGVTAGCSGDAEGDAFAAAGEQTLVASR